MCVFLLCSPVGLECVRCYRRVLMVAHCDVHVAALRTQRRVLVEGCLKIGGGTFFPMVSGGAATCQRHTHAIFLD